MFTAYKNLPTCPNINKSPPDERIGTAFFSDSGSDGKTAIGWLIVVRPKVRGRRADCGSRIALRYAMRYILPMKNPVHPGKILATMYLDPLGLTVTQAVVELNMPRAALVGNRQWRALRAHSEEKAGCMRGYFEKSWFANQLIRNNLTIL